MTATYVYGLVNGDATLPDGLTGLGPSGSVSTIRHDGLAAVVSDVPVDRPLGTRDDLLAHEAVVDAVARSLTVLPMRFPAVLEESGVVEELLGPYRDRFAAVLDRLEGKVQYTLKGRYEQDVLLREIIEEEPEIRDLNERVRGQPEEAAHYDRLRLGELIVGAMQQRGEVDGRDVVERLDPYAAASSVEPPTQPEDVVTAAFLVERERMTEFEAAVEELGADTYEWMRLRLLGPLAPYDFVGELEG